MLTLKLFLFNERMERLERCKLTKIMENPNYKLDYDRMMERQWISINGIEEDDVDAFILNLRLLIQDRDGFSIRRLAEDIYADSTLPQTLRDKFTEKRAIWNEYR